jgi:hypothetical protein
MSGLVFLGWVSVYSVSIAIVPFVRQFRGKILTMPIRRRVRCFRIEALVGRRDRRGFMLRMVQIFVLSLVNFVGISDAVATVIYWLGASAFFVDDYLTGDDDRWKRFTDAVRNKVSWKMLLPAPVKVRETA